jgi:hypothetical protein
LNPGPYEEIVDDAIEQTTNGHLIIPKASKENIENKICFI